MTKEEASKVVEELLQENDPEEVASGFYRMYIDGKIEFEDLEFLVDLCGYELADEFKNATDEERKTMYEKGEEKPEDVLEEESEPKAPEEKAPEGEDRASKDENYNGEKVYDENGAPTQAVEAQKEEEDEEAKAGKLYNLKF